uniref:Mammalian ependymin-related protein 1 n=2 Tax=Passeriformes TaxID=9126 RepID=A0A8C5ITC8_JUNHY
MLPAKAAGSLEKSTVQGGNCDLLWLQGGASRISSHSSCSFCLFLPPGSSSHSLFQVLGLVGSRPGYTAQEGTGVNCCCCYRFFEYILLYKDAVMFQIEQVTKLCSKIALTEPWDPYDIPANSTYEDQYYIGGPGDEVMVQEWSDRKPARKLESWVGVYTVKDCYPVQETYTKNYSVTTSTRFFDIHPGIADPSVFTPPSTCQTAQLTRMREEC